MRGSNDSTSISNSNCNGNNSGGNEQMFKMHIWNRVTHSQMIQETIAYIVLLDIFNMNVHYLNIYFILFIYFRTSLLFEWILTLSFNSLCFYFCFSYAPKTIFLFSMHDFAFRMSNEFHGSSATAKTLLHLSLHISLLLFCFSFPLHLVCFLSPSLPLHYNSVSFFFSCLNLFVELVNAMVMCVSEEKTCSHHDECPTISKGLSFELFC